MTEVYSAGMQTAYEGAVHEVLFTRHELALDWAVSLTDIYDLPIRDHTKGEEPYYKYYKVSPGGDLHKKQLSYIFISSLPVYDDFHNPDWLRQRLVREGR